MRKFFTTLVFMLTVALAGQVWAAMPPTSDTRDSEGYFNFYLRGDMNNWAANDQYKFTREGNVYTLTLDKLNGEFKVGSSQWTYNLGHALESNQITGSTIIEGVENGKNIKAVNLQDVTISFRCDVNGYFLDHQLRVSLASDPITEPWPEITDDPVDPVVPDDPVSGIAPSGTLPVLYINAYKVDSEGNIMLDSKGNKILDNELISKDLDHKNYFTGEYWLDVLDLQYLKDKGIKSIGSKEEPLPLEIKARGNYTRTAFAKKPFKLKLGKKQNLLGLTPDKSKHYAILAHADDYYGFMRNFVGFNLGDRIGLPWTPDQQPVEVVINGDYRGLYFLTESIRVGDGRVPIVELKDNVDDSKLISGGYLVELDNYEETNQITLEEKSCASGWHYLDPLRITWNTPEMYSDLQRRFVTDQFTAMNDYVGSNDDKLWSYLDLDDAVRYYIVKEVISDVESYHGSTYLYRDFGDDQKWHFSPLWDCGNAFNGSTSDYFYNCDPYGNTWIPSLRENAKFNAKLIETWRWFMSSRYNGLVDDINDYAQLIATAAKNDWKRWDGAPTPLQGVSNNSDMKARKQSVIDHLAAKTQWLASQWGNYSGSYSEPERDSTPAAPLPAYASTGVESVSLDAAYKSDVYYNLQGIPVDNPSQGIFILNGKKVLVK